MPLPSRTELRLRLQAARDAFVARPAAADIVPSDAAFARHLSAVLAALQPACLGLYWPMRSEFNAAAACLADRDLEESSFALPYTHREPPAMQYRLWDGEPPTLRDECKVPASDGAPVLPDVVLVPCLGFTRAGLRLGYGGGFFDRWLASHPEVTPVGVAWSIGELTTEDIAKEAHDVPMMLIVTEQGVVSD